MFVLWGISATQTFNQQPFNLFEFLYSLFSCVFFDFHLPKTHPDGDSPFSWFVFDWFKNQTKACPAVLYTCLKRAAQMGPSMGIEVDFEKNGCFAQPRAPKKDVSTHHVLLTCCTDARQDLN